MGQDQAGFLRSLGDRSAIAVHWDVNHTFPHTSRCGSLVHWDAPFLGSRLQHVNACRIWLPTNY
uniref:Uncharacterized protein n=1 Tax=Rhizophora mucronata TaxID=61149 RepID=A0A2P2QBP1_RHIMU